MKLRKVINDNNMFRQFGLIGKKLGHSFSKKYFSDKFENEGINAAYELFELSTIAEFPNLIKNTPYLTGLNVTIPYKAQVIPYLDELSPRAQAIQAVNTIRVSKGRLLGDNSDIYGFSESLKSLYDADNLPEKAIILGTGGASNAVAYVLDQMKIAYIKVSRSPSGIGQISYGALSDLPLNEYQLIINTTPLGMYPHTEEAPEFPYQLLGEQHIAYDLIYNPPETSFMKKASEFGTGSKNGMEMLILQAEGSWKIWNE